jgi:hypothetical protein
MQEIRIHVKPHHTQVCGLIFAHLHTVGDTQEGLDARLCRVVARVQRFLVLSVGIRRESQAPQCWSAPPRQQLVQRIRILPRFTYYNYGRCYTKSIDHFSILEVNTFWCGIVDCILVGSLIRQEPNGRSTLGTTGPWSRPVIILYGSCAGVGR